MESAADREAGGRRLASPLASAATATLRWSEFPPSRGENFDFLLLTVRKKSHFVPEREGVNGEEAGGRERDRKRARGATCTQLAVPDCQEEAACSLCVSTSRLEAQTASC